MTYAHTMDVPQPIEMYDKVRVEVEQEVRGPMPEGWVQHMVVEIPSVFRVVEVWASHEAADRFGDEVMRPIIGRVTGPEVLDEGPSPCEELKFHRLDKQHTAPRNRLRKYERLARMRRERAEPVAAMPVAVPAAVLPGHGSD